MTKQNEQYKILIVDDNVENIQILSEILNGYKKSIATSGKIALELANADPKPDLILLDIMMPNMDGYEVCEKLKNNPKTKDIPVIFITASNQIKDEIKGFELGAVDFITKPVSPPKVVTRVKTHLAMSGYRIQLENMNEILGERVRERTIELEISRDEAEESSRIKSHFLTLVNHELQTPMVGILGFSEILKNECKDEKLQGFASSLYESSERLGRTLNAILNLSRLESNKKFIDSSSFNPIERIAHLIEMHKMSAEVKGINLSYKSEIDSILIYTDLLKFDIIFNNLIENAIKYTNKGEVIVNVYASGDKDVHDLKVTVVDTGIGISEDKQEIIFEEFRQADERVKRNFEGVGLGLSIVKKYVQYLNGSIELESKLGKGSMFTVTIPSYKTFKDMAAESFSTEKSLKSKIPDEKIQLLIVEDDETSLLVHQYFLEKFCEITIAKTADEALQSSQDKKFDSILIDINLGRGDSGIEITKAIRKIDLNASTPIIALIPYELDDDKAVFIDAGFNDFLVKPAVKNQLRETVLKNIK